MSTELPSIVKELAAAASIQAQAANRLWLALMTVVVFALFHRSPSPTGGADIPGGIGSIPDAAYVPVLLVLLAVLSVAFASAHAQHVRAQKLARRKLKADCGTGSKHSQELFDMMCEPSVIRVAPLSQSLRLDWQFHDTAGGCPPWLIRISAVHYAILKLGAILVYFGLPQAALWLVYARATDPYYLLLLPAILAGGTLLQVTLVELADGCRIFRIIRTPSASPE